MRALKLSRALKLCPNIKMAHQKIFGPRPRLLINNHTMSRSYPVKNMVDYWDNGGEIRGFTKAQIAECREFMRLRKGKGR
jgi:hypothetical protein